MRYPQSKRLIQKAFELICAHREISVTALRKQYIDALNITESKVRSWQSGTARPSEPDEIVYIVRDAIINGRLGESWVRDFLRTTDAPQTLWQPLLDEARLRNKDVSVPTQEPLRIYPLPFENGHTARAIKVDEVDEIVGALEALGIAQHRPSLLVVGGADGMNNEDTQRLRKFIEQVVVPTCEGLQVTVMTGGTNSGIMKLVGKARNRARATFPLIGIAAIGTVQLPGNAPSKNQAPLEPHHDAFVFVPGADWSNESPWLVRISAAISHNTPALTLVANGGEITWHDILYSIVAGRPVLAIEGTGRATDVLAKISRLHMDNPRAQAFNQTGLVQAIDVLHISEAITMLKAYLGDGQWPAN